MDARVRFLAAARRLAITFVLMALLAPTTSAMAAPATSTRVFDLLYAEFDTLPTGQFGTHDRVDVLLSHTVTTENGVVADDRYAFVVYVVHFTWDADFNTAGYWAGSYSPSPPAEPVAFGPRGVAASRTLTWQCLTGDCPARPATIDATVTAMAVGAPRTTTLTGPGSPGPDVGVIQLYDTVLTLDTDGAIALPPLVSWAWLQHGWSRTLDR